MAATLITTTGAANANSYLTLAEAQDYADADYDAALWYDLTADKKTRALITATYNLDLLSFISEQLTTTQSLAWPRLGYPTPPSEIKRATWEVANALSKNVTITGPATGTTSLLPGIANSSLKRLKLDVLDVEWKTDTPSRISVLKALPHLQSLLRDLLSPSNNPGPTISIVRS